MRSLAFTVHVTKHDDRVMLAWVLCCEACGEAMTSTRPSDGKEEGEARDGQVFAPLNEITAILHQHLHQCFVRPILDRSYLSYHEQPR